MDIIQTYHLLSQTQVRLEPGQEQLLRQCSRGLFLYILVCWLHATHAHADHTIRTTATA